jgi:hypothetical protein
MADSGKDSHGGTGTRRIKIIAGIRFENGAGKKACLTCIEKRILFSKCNLFQAMKANKA